MKDWFLFRLYRNSRLGFLVVILFILGYAYCLTHKMDMMMFPYNAMFAYDRKPGDSIMSYRIMVNDKDMHYTRFSYWKKDFLETSPRVFAHYLASGNTVYVDQYIKDSWGHGAMATWIKSRLSPGAVDLPAQMAWYARKAGIKARPGDVLSLWAVYLTKNAGGDPVVTGSRQILTVKFPG